MTTELKTVVMREGLMRSEAIKRTVIDEVVHDSEFRKQLLKRIYPEIVEMLEIEGWVKK